MPEKFKVGDRVVGIGIVDNRDIDGISGTIKRTWCTGDYYVRFDEAMGGWSDFECGIPDGHGWTVNSKNLELIERKKPDMTNIEKAQAELEAAQRDMDAAKERIEAAKKKLEEPEKVDWLPKDGELYCLIRSNYQGAQVDRVFWADDSSDTDATVSGNIFPADTDEAQRVADMFNLFLLIRKKAKDDGGYLGMMGDAPIKGEANILYYSESAKRPCSIPVVAYAEKAPLIPLLTAETAQKLKNDPEIVALFEKIKGGK